MERLRAFSSWITTGMVTLGLAVAVVLSNHVLTPATLTGASAPTAVATAPHTTSAPHAVSVTPTTLEVASVRKISTHRPTTTAPQVQIKTVADVGTTTTSTSTTTTTTTTTVPVTFPPASTTTRPHGDDGGGGNDN